MFTLNVWMDIPSQLLSFPGIQLCLLGLFGDISHERVDDGYTGHSTLSFVKVSGRHGYNMGPLIFNWIVTPWILFIITICIYNKPS